MSAIVSIDMFYREERAIFERQIDRNDRMLELARHNGFELDLSAPRKDLGGKRLWIVPPVMQAMCGAMGLVVR